MSSSITNQVAYLRTSREFPEDLNLLSNEVNRSYLDIANAVNVRIIGIFSANRPSISGETWFLTNRKQQGLRQAYAFTSTASIPHGITFSKISRITRCYGEFTDGTNWYGLISGSNVAIAGQISFYLDPTNIVFMVGAGAPTISSTQGGVIVIEWISNV